MVQVVVAVLPCHGSNVAETVQSQRVPVELTFIVMQN
jgi:hypothetical protein